MRGNTILSPAAMAFELLPGSYFAPLDFTSIFPRRAPLEVDLGCGDGSFLTALARGNPARNFLGIERLLGRVRSACRKAAHENLDNVRVLRLEISYAIRYLLTSESVAVFHLLFPDPWPKKRHHRRRIVTPEFLGSVYHALTPNGVLRIATDQTEYFEHILGLSASQPGFAPVRIQPDESLPTSAFAKQFRLVGVESYWLELRKTSPVK